MFTVLSNTRNSNFFLIAALAVMVVILSTFAVVPAISAPNSADVVVAGASESRSDYYERHLELRAPAAGLNGDFALRHPEWTISVRSAAVPVTGAFEASDYFQRHPELSVSAGLTVDMSDYFTRHPELRTPAESSDLSDYFQRH